MTDPYRTSLALPFLLMAALLLRLHHLGVPILGTNSWRMADNAAMARNYLEPGGRGFCYPRVDWGGDGPGFVQSEFPAYPYAVSLLYRCFGVGEIPARALSVTCSLIGLAFLYLAVLEAAGARAAFWSGFFLAFLPLSVYYGRAAMAEPAMLAALTGGVWLFMRWSRTGSPAALVSSGVLVSLGCLLKAPSLYIGLPLVWLAWLRHGKAAWRRWELWGYAALVLVPVALWYWHSGRVLAEGGLSLFGDWRFGTDKWGNTGLLLSWEFWNRILFERLAGKHLTWVGFAFLVGGLFTRVERPVERVFEWWLAAALIFTAIVAKGSFVHEHYQLAFLPPAAAIMARVAVRPLAGRPVILGLAVTAMLVLSAVRYARTALLELPSRSPLWRMAVDLKARSAPGDLVVVLDNGDPTALYLAGRKGWVAHDYEVRSPEARGLFRERARRGARWFAGLYSRLPEPEGRARLDALLRQYGKVVSTGEYFIVRMPGRTR